MMRTKNLIQPTILTFTKTLIFLFQTYSIQTFHKLRHHLVFLLNIKQIKDMLSNSPFPDPHHSLIGLTFMDKPHYFDPQQQKWFEIKAEKLKFITADPKGGVWGINWKKDIVTGEGLISGNGVSIGTWLSSFVVGHDGRIYGVGNFNDVHSGFIHDKNWVQVSNQKMNKLALDNWNRLWGINSNGQIFVYDTNQGPKGTWQKIPSNINPGKLVDLCSTPNGSIWALNQKGDILERQSGDTEWRVSKNTASSNITGVKHFAVKQFETYGIDSFNKTYRFREGKWIQFGSEKMSFIV